MVIGGWIQICEPAIVEIMCSYKFDWITFDLEHGLFSTKDLSNLVRAAELSKKIKLARLPNHNKDFCSLVLDAGCDGVIVPNIKNEVELIKNEKFDLLSSDRKKRCWFFKRKFIQ